MITQFPFQLPMPVGEPGPEYTKKVVALLNKHFAEGYDHSLALQLRHAIPTDYAITDSAAVEGSVLHNPVRHRAEIAIRDQWHPMLIGEDAGAVLPEWFGAAGDGVTDDRTAIQEAINYASKTKAARVQLSHKTYRSSGPIYFFYDAALNPGFYNPPSGTRHGRIILQGAGAMDISAIRRAPTKQPEEIFGSTIEFDAGDAENGLVVSSDALGHDGSPFPARKAVMRAFNIIYHGTGWAIEMASSPESLLDDLSIACLHLDGNGVYFNTAWFGIVRRCYVIGPQTFNNLTDVGVTGLTFTSDTIERLDGGSWIDDGYAVGHYVFFDNTTNGWNEGTNEILAATPSTLTVAKKFTRPIHLDTSTVQVDIPSSTTIVRLAGSWTDATGTEPALQIGDTLEILTATDAGNVGEHIVTGFSTTTNPDDTVILAGSTLTTRTNDTALTFQKKFCFRTSAVDTTATVAPAPRGVGFSGGTSLAGGEFEIIDSLFDSFADTFEWDGNQIYNCLSVTNTAFQKASRYHMHFKDGTVSSVNMTQVYFEGKSRQHDIFVGPDGSMRSLDIRGMFILGGRPGAPICHGAHFKLDNVPAFRCSNIFLFRPWSTLIDYAGNNSTGNSVGTLENIVVVHDYGTNVDLTREGPIYLCTGALIPDINNVVYTQMSREGSYYVDPYDPASASAFLRLWDWQTSAAPVHARDKSTGTLSIPRVAFGESVVETGLTSQYSIPGTANNVAFDLTALNDITALLPNGSSTAVPGRYFAVQNNFASTGFINLRGSNAPTGTIFEVLEPGFVAHCYYNKKTNDYTILVSSASSYIKAGCRNDGASPPTLTHQVGDRTLTCVRAAAGQWDYTISRGMGTLGYQINVQLEAVGGSYATIATAATFSVFTTDMTGAAADIAHRVRVTT